MILLLWTLAATVTMVGLGLWSLSELRPRRRAGLAVAVVVITILLASLEAGWLAVVWLAIGATIHWRGRSGAVADESSVAAIPALTAAVLIVVLVAAFYLVIERITWPDAQTLGIEAWLILAAATFGWGLLVAMTRATDDDLPPTVLVMLGGAAITAAALVRHGVLSGAAGRAPALLALILAGVLLVAGSRLVTDEDPVTEDDS